MPKERPPTKRMRRFPQSQEIGACFQGSSLVAAKISRGRENCFAWDLEHWLSKNEGVADCAHKQLYARDFCSTAVFWKKEEKESSVAKKHHAFRPKKGAQNRKTRWPPGPDLRGRIGKAARQASAARQSPFRFWRKKAPCEGGKGNSRPPERRSAKLGSHRVGQGEAANAPAPLA